MYRKCIRENITGREICYIQGENVFLADNTYDPRCIMINEASNCIYVYGQPAARVDGNVIFSYNGSRNVAYIEGNTIKVIENQFESYEIDGDDCTDLEKAALFIGARR